MSRAPRNSPITEHQWEHIFGILDGACYGSNAAQVAWTWLRSNGCVMQLPTFYERLRKERRARNEKAAAGAAAAGAAEAAAAATAALLMVDAVPLAGAFFVAEGATEPPAAHGGLAAAHDVGHNAHEPGSADDSQAGIGQKRTHEASFSSSASVEPEVQGELGIAAEASAPPADLSDGSDQPSLLLQTACALLRMRESELQFEVQRLVARNREFELQQLEVQQLVARNRELELQLKVHKLAQATLRVAEAEEARWCAPRLLFYKCRRCPLYVPGPQAPLSCAFVRLFPVCEGWTTNEAPRSGLPTGGP